MRCHVCAADMVAVITDMPFKIGRNAIVILKALPVLQCTNCGEYLIEDPVMDRVDFLLGRVNKGAELEIVPYAA